VVVTRLAGKEGELLPELAAEVKRDAPGKHTGGVN